MKRLIRNGKGIPDTEGKLLFPQNMTESVRNLHEQKSVSEIVARILVKGTPVLYKGDGLRLTINVCYSWEMALSVGIDVSFDNM
jgi:hypothetical protein